MLGKPWNLIIPISTDDCISHHPYPANDFIIKYWHVRQVIISWICISLLPCLTVIQLLWSWEHWPQAPRSSTWRVWRVLSTQCSTHLAGPESWALWQTLWCSTTHHYTSFKQFTPDRGQSLFSNLKTFSVLQHWVLLCSRLSSTEIRLPAVPVTLHWNGSCLV